MTIARDTADLLILAPTAQATEPVETLPLIINGTFRVKQRMDAETVRNGLNIDVSGNHTHDRWKLEIINAGAVDTTTD